MLTKKQQRLRRSRQTRIRILQQGVARLTVFRSNQHVFASVISDDGTRILATASTVEKEVREQLDGLGKGANTAAATLIGKRFHTAVVSEPGAIERDPVNSRGLGTLCNARPHRGGGGNVAALALGTELLARCRFGR